MLADVEPVDLLVRGHPDSSRDELRHVPEDHREPKTIPAMSATPMSCGPSWSIPPPMKRPRLATAAEGATVGSAKSPTAIVPNTPFTRCTDVAPDRVVDPDLVEEHDRRDDQEAGDEPDDERLFTLTNAQGAVMATRPARQPLSVMPRSGLTSSQAAIVEEIVPAAAAMLVVTAM